MTLDAYAVADRILIDVKDHCGGLPSGDPERMFLPFTLDGVDKSGLGLGLSIARRGVESNDGTLTWCATIGKSAFATTMMAGGEVSKAA